MDQQRKCGYRLLHYSAKQLPADQDNGDDVDAKKDPESSIRQIRASTDAIVAQVNKVADHISDNSDLGKSFRRTGSP